MSDQQFPGGQLPSQDQIREEHTQQTRKAMYDANRYESFSSYWEWLLKASSQSNAEAHWRRVECAIADGIHRQLARIADNLEILSKPGSNKIAETPTH